MLVFARLGNRIVSSKIDSMIVEECMNGARAMLICILFFDFTFLICFFTVFLAGNDAALPMGSCTFMEFFCSARKCSTAFYKALQKDSKANCG